MTGIGTLSRLVSRRIRLTNARKSVLGLALGLNLALGLGLGLLPAAPAAAKDFYRLSTLGPGSSPYTVMSTFAKVVNQHLPELEIQVNATGAATRHAIDAAKDQLDFFMWSASVHASMLKGTTVYAKTPEAPALAKNLRGIFAFPIGVYHIVVYADSGINSLADIKGKRVFLGPPGGGALVTAMQLVEGVTGYKADVDYKAIKLGWDAAAQSFQDKQLDVYINPTNAPSPVISQIALTSKIRLLGLSDADFARPGMQGVLGQPGRTREVIAAGTYGANQVNTGPTRSIGSMVGIATRKGMPEEVIYRITRTFWSHLDEAHAVAPWMKQIKFETALEQMNLPLHPGALRYYRERGVKVPETLVPKG